MFNALYDLLMMCTQTVREDMYSLYLCVPPAVNLCPLDVICPNASSAVAE